MPSFFMVEGRCDDCRRSFTDGLVPVTRPVKRLFSRQVETETAILCRGCMRKVDLYFDKDDVLKVNRRVSPVKNSFSIERDVYDEEGLDEGK